jgi:hypothetical protein
MTMVLPVGIGYEDWFIQLIQDLPKLKDVPVRPQEDNWVEDVQLLLRNDQCVLLGAPRPESFSDWRSWAESFVKSYGSLV